MADSVVNKSATQTKSLFHSDDVAAVVMVELIKPKTQFSTSSAKTDLASFK